MLGSSSHVRVRSGQLSDAKDLADVFERSWRHAYVGILPRAHLDSLILRRGRRWWTSAIRSGDLILVLEVAGEICGYASCGPARHRGRYEGEIYELYLVPEYQGLGFGELLFEACRNVLDQRKLNGLIVWALSDNEIAADFYWRRGGRPVQQLTDRVGTVDMCKVGFAWT
jgi:ribosomal protein S18 acetylase RimI-like enzyme